MAKATTPKKTAAKKSAAKPAASAAPAKKTVKKKPPTDAQLEATIARATKELSKRLADAKKKGEAKK